jgi:26S proteasome regulatory subunit N1
LTSPYLKGLALEIDDDIAADDNDKEVLQEIVNNTKLSEGYLTLARDVEVMEPKSPEDIYKVAFHYSPYFWRHYSGES